MREIKSGVSGAGVNVDLINKIKTGNVRIGLIGRNTTA